MLRFHRFRRFSWHSGASIPSRPSFAEDKAVHVVGEVGERDLGLSALDADRADEQSHLVFLPGKEMFDPGADH